MYWQCYSISKTGCRSIYWKWIFASRFDSRVTVLSWMRRAQVGQSANQLSGSEFWINACPIELTWGDPSTVTFVTSLRRATRKPFWCSNCARVFGGIRWIVRSPSLESCFTEKAISVLPEFWYESMLTYFSLSKVVILCGIVLRSTFWMRLE